MGAWCGAILTKVGKQLQGRVEAGELKLKLKKMKIGDGVPTVLENMTNLVNSKQIVDITSVINNGDGTVVVTGLISNVGLAEGYYLREYGLFAEDENGNEILYCVSTDSNPDYLPAQSATPTVVSEELGLTIAISNASKIDVTIAMTGYATKAQLAAHIQDKTMHCFEYDQYGDIMPRE